MYSKLEYFEKTLNIIKNISSYFPPLRKIEKEIKIELEIEKDKKDNWDENKKKIKDEWSRY